MAMTIEAQESVGLEPGTYEGEITDIFEKDGVYNGEPTEQYQFTIIVDGETKKDGSAVEQWAFCNRVLSPKSKLWKWVNNYTGQPPAIGKVVDLHDIFLGKRIGFLVSINQNGKPVVTDIYKPRGGAPAAAPRRAAPAQAKAEEEQQEQMICGFPKCGRPAFSMDDEDGTPVCPKHGGLPDNA